VTHILAPVMPQCVQAGGDTVAPVQDFGNQRGFIRNW